MINNLIVVKMFKIFNWNKLSKIFKILTVGVVVINFIFQVTLKIYFIMDNNLCKLSLYITENSHKILTWLFAQLNNLLSDYDNHS